MKKLLKLTFLIGLFVLLATPCFAAGMTYSSYTYCVMEEPLEPSPVTIEATVSFPADFGTARGGVIVGNFDNTNPSVSLEIYTKGVPRLYIKDNDLKNHDIKFSDINVYTGSPVHIAVVQDIENGLVHCYIDGELKQTVEAELPDSVSLPTSMYIGGDRRGGNGMYCKGEVFDVALYSDMRTAEEVLSDYTNGNKDTTELLAYYDLTGYADAKAPVIIPDLSGNSNDCDLIAEWIENMDLPENFSYSFAAIGDTQTIARYYPQYMTNIYDWIVDNADKNNLKFVFGLGDITDTSSNAEWAVSKAVIQKLDGVVPYSVIRGNHDTIETYNQFITYSDFGKNLAGTYDGTMLNTYQYLTVNGIKYLIFGLDYGAADEVLSWAGEIIAQNKDCNVIITTHAYLYHDGTISDNAVSAEEGGYNNGVQIWEKLIKNHENIVLVISGHYPDNFIILSQTEGESGNVVSQMLIDPQIIDKNLEGLGLVAMLYFSEDGKKVDVRYYSTVRNKYYQSGNQFSFDINVIEPSEEIPPAPETQINSISFNVTLTASEYSGKIIAALYDEFGNMTAMETYDAQENVPVSFPEAATAATAKVFWWNGLDTITPVCEQSVLDFIN